MTITIPPEVLEAGKDTAFNWLRSHMEDDVRVREMTAAELTELVSAACLATLRAWPGMLEARRGAVFTNSWQEPRKGEQTNIIILPLTENSND